jgi:general secretion pathway protein C
VKCAAITTETPIVSAGFLHLPSQLPTSPWFHRGINAAAVILLASGVAHWTWSIVRAPTPPVSLPASAVTARTTNASVDSLVSAHMFGRADQTAPAALDKIPVSSLNLVLTGVFDSGSNSYALISVAGGKQAPFAVGDQITNGVTLESVYADRVIILRGGKRESLLMYTDEDSGSNNSLPPVPNESAPPSPGNTFDISRAQVEQQLRNPSIMARARIVPYAGGGFMISSIPQNSLFTKAGLRRGDIIKSVNGEPLNNYSDAMKMMQSMGGIENVQQLNIEILRHGHPQHLQYNIR